jgi:hypothetical protein
MSNARTADRYHVLHVRLDYAQRIDVPRADYAIVERHEFNDVTFPSCIEKLFHSSGISLQRWMLSERLGSLNFRRARVSCTLLFVDACTQLS